jgi:hypothetical protein
MGETDYQVIWPLGKLASRNVTLQSRIPDLNGKTICEISDYIFRSEEIFPAVREELRKIYPDIKFIEYTHFGNIHGVDEAEVIRSLPSRLKEHGCDGVISGVGG